MPSHTTNRRRAYRSIPYRDRYSYFVVKFYPRRGDDAYVWLHLPGLRVDETIRHLVRRYRLAVWNLSFWHANAIGSWSFMSRNWCFERCLWDFHSVCDSYSHLAEARPCPITPKLTASHIRSTINYSFWIPGFVCGFSSLRDRNFEKFWSPLLFELDLILSDLDVLFFSYGLSTGTSIQKSLSPFFLPIATS